MLSLVVRHAEPGPILDVGAGAGFLVEAATRWGMDATGVDGAEEAIAVALARAPRLKLSHYLLSHPLPFEDGSFQTVLLHQVIEHLDEETGRTVAAEAFRVLRESGVLMVYSPNRLNRTEAAADPTHLKVYSPSELRALLTGAGFHRIVPVDSPRPLLGSSFLGRGLMYVLFMLTGWERLSATASCLAWKR